MDSVDIDLLKSVTARSSYEESKDIVKSYMLTDVAWGILKDFGDYYERHTCDAINEVDFRAWFRMEAHPEWKHEKHKLYGAIFDNVFDSESEVSATVVKTLSKQRLLACIKQAADEGSYEDIATYSNDLAKIDTLSSVEDKIVKTKLSELIRSAIRFDGYSWRLEDLNRSVGPVGGGDLILVGKRPETGGTSFMLSEMTHWLHQLPEGKGVLLVHNEEATDRFMTRLASCALDSVSTAAGMDPDEFEAEYEKWLDGRCIDVVSEPDTSIYDIEQLMASGKYGAVGINVVEKLRGSWGTKIEDFQRLERLGAWARALAVKSNVPIIGIVQADMSAEGVRYPDQTMLYKSKTGLQGEADVLLMIGRDTQDETVDEDTRFIHVAKNKLPGDSKTLHTLRHLKSEVHFATQTGRYTSKNSWM